MPTKRPPTSGRGQENSIDKLDKYQKASRSASKGTFMRTFSRTKTSQLVTAWNDIHYLTVMNNRFLWIADGTGAVDSATVPFAATMNLLNVAWELYYTNANLKDLVAAEEESWKLYFAVYLQLATEIQLQYNFRTLLPAYTESDTVPGNNTNISYLNQSSFDIFVASMAEFPAPKGVDHLVKLFCSWIVELSPGYEKYTLKIPPAYFVPFMASYDLADLEAMRELLRVNLGNFITHSKKFGLGTGSWSDPVKPVVKSLDDPDVIAYFNHVWFMFYDNTPGTQLVHPDGGFAGVNRTTDFTGVEYFFKDSPNESPIHVLAPLFGTYNITNNPYGGIIIEETPAATEYEVNMVCVSQHGTDAGAIGLNDPNVNMILSCTKAYDDGNDAVFKVFNNGTNFTATQEVSGNWKFGIHHKLLMGAGRGATETENDLLNYIGKMIT